jgi:excisionase family DNA binding protein
MQLSTVHARIVVYNGDNTKGGQVDERYLKIPEVATRLGVSRGTVYNFINAGKLEAVKIGKSRRVALSALQRFVEAEQKAAAEAGKGDPNPA